MFTAFLPVDQPPDFDAAREYLLDGALFDTRPTISVHRAPDGSFERMELRYAPDRKPMVLRRLRDEDADAARGEAVDLASLCAKPAIVTAIEGAPLVLEWEVERRELDEDAWFALHLWQAWILKPSRGWLYAPGDGLFDADLQRRCSDAS